jgi:pyruvate,water dikinase
MGGVMKWFGNLFGNTKSDPLLDLKTIQGKFENFIYILDQNNQILKIIGDLEEKSQGDYLFDINYIRGNLGQIKSGVERMIQALINLGGDKYEPLKKQYEAIAVSDLLSDDKPIARDSFTIPFDSIDSGFAGRVGGKSARLGELKSKLGLPAPDGFAITAWAYQYFLKANSLQPLIEDAIRSLNYRSMEDLDRTSDKIRDLVISKPVPANLASEILGSYDRIFGSAVGANVALRSSAIGEDSTFSFAGQYATFLNVPRSRLIDRYREIIASKFTPRAIYYALSHSLSSAELAMGVGCVAMIDARASGVIYTCDPVNPGNHDILINSIFGLGKYLVDGIITPDAFRVSREDPGIKESIIAMKSKRLVFQGMDGIKEESVPEEEACRAALNEKEIMLLAQYAVKIEEYYGCPQDIEWAIDRSGQIYILQARPLRVLEQKAGEADVDTSNMQLLVSGGVTICPGAGAGPVFRGLSVHDLTDVPRGAILVAPNPLPGIVTVMDRVNAIVTCTGNVASHMANLAREYRVPTLGGIAEAMDLAPGREITVDATRPAIYSGIYADLVKARRPETSGLEDIMIFDLLKNVLARVAPLSLLHPADSSFSIENCRTFHDITRFVHQKALEEMFYGATHVGYDDLLSSRLKTDIPLKVDIICIDREPEDDSPKREISEEQIESEPMKFFWNGVKAEGWPAPAAPGDIKGFMGVLATSMAGSGGQEFSETSFAVLGKEYMMLSIRMGYHFSTIESFCSAEPSKNFIRIQYKDGGASIDRRIRRIRLIEEILIKMGFEKFSKGDFLDARITYRSKDDIASRLVLLGRLSIKTKQLDMALSNDAVARWYTEDFINALGLNDEAGRNGHV